MQRAVFGNGEEGGMGDAAKDLGRSHATSRGKTIHRVRPVVRERQERSTAFLDPGPRLPILLFASR